MSTYRIHYTVTLRSSIDFDAPSEAEAIAATRDYLRRAYGYELETVEIRKSEVRS